jgi:hypothetical protein
VNPTGRIKIMMAVACVIAAEEGNRHFVELFVGDDDVIVE